ncbi:MAG: ATP synthase F1 subunit gamma [Bacteroidota bacterium]
MPNLKEVRTRITSVTSTKQITSAMKMVSASKFRKAQTAIVKLRPYANKLKEIMQNVSSGENDAVESPYSQTRTPEKILLVVVSSNKGLCGAFNANVIKRTIILINEEYSTQYKNGGIQLLTVGKKGSEYFNKRNFPSVGQFDSIYENLNFENVSKIAEMVMAKFANKEFDRVEIIYNQYKNAATQVLTNEQFLPLSSIESNTVVKQNVDYIYEPSKQVILQELIPKSLKIQFFKVLLDSFASEHGARMTAMHKATDNAEDLLRELKLTYNKARQASITKEILEIVSGAEALKG